MSLPCHMKGEVGGKGASRTFGTGAGYRRHMALLVKLKGIPWSGPINIPGVCCLSLQLCRLPSGPCYLLPQGRCRRCRRCRLPASALSQQSFLLQDLPSLPVVFPVLPTLFLAGSREAEGKALAFLKDPVQLSLSLRVQGSLLPSWVCNASLFGGNGSYIITHFFCYMVHDINPML